MSNQKTSAVDPNTVVDEADPEQLRNAVVHMAAWISNALEFTGPLPDSKLKGKSTGEVVDHYVNPRLTLDDFDAK